MNSLGRSARGAIILLVALAIGTWIISRTTTVELAGAGANPTTPTEGSTTSTTPTTTPSATPPRDLKTVRVLMVNGTKTDGVAKKARNCIVGTFDALPPTNTNKKPSEAALYAKAGFEEEARKVAKTLNITLEPLPFPTTTDFKAVPNPLPDIILVIGDSIASSIRNLPCAVSVVPANN
jgi:hypothetical protein